MWLRAGAAFTLQARAMDSLSPVALLLTQSLAGQLMEVVEQLHARSGVATLEQQVSAVAVH